MLLGSEKNEGREKRGSFADLLFGVVHGALSLV